MFIQIKQLNGQKNLRLLWMFEFHAFAIFLEKNATLEESFWKRCFLPSSQTKTCQVPK